MLNNYEKILMWKEQYLYAALSLYKKINLNIIVVYMDYDDLLDRVVVC